MSEEDNQRWLVIDGRGERLYQGGGEYDSTPNFFGQEEFSSYDEMILCVKKHIDCEVQRCNHNNLKRESAIPHLMFYKIQEEDISLPKEIEKYFSEAESQLSGKQSEFALQKEAKLKAQELDTLRTLKAKYPNLA